MHKNLIKISTLKMSREEWLLERKKSLGGSDVAALLGFNAYSSPYSVWAEKMGLTEDIEDNEAMRQGRDLEQYVADRFCEATGKKVRRENSIIRNPEMPYLHANVDRVVVGEDAVLECKTVSALSLSRYKNGNYPPRFYAQVCEYMLVCGFKKAYIAVLVLGRDFYIFEVERDEAELNALKNTCEAFWKFVETKTAPPADGMSATADALKEVFPQSDGSRVELFGREAKLDSYMAIKAKIADLEDELTEIENLIKADMGSAEIGEIGTYEVTWKTSSPKTTFDSKKYMADHKEEDFSKYIKHGSSARPFKVKVRKED